MSSNETEYEKLRQQSMRESNILRSLQEANKRGDICEFSEEQIVEAQKEIGKNSVNEVYYKEIFPMISGILYVVYYIMTLIVLPILYFGGERGVIWGAVLAYIALVISYIVIDIVDKRVKKQIKKERKCLEWLNKFSLDTTVLVYLLTSIGYMLIALNTFLFWFIYVIMVIAFIVAFKCDVVVPLIKYRKEKREVKHL